MKFVESQGFPMESHNIVTIYPRRILSAELNTLKTLKELDLYPSEMVIVEEKYPKED